MSERGVGFAYLSNGCVSTRSQWGGYLVESIIGPGFVSGLSPLWFRAVDTVKFLPFAVGEAFVQLLQVDFCFV